MARCSHLTPKESFDPIRIRRFHQASWLLKLVAAESGPIMKSLPHEGALFTSAELTEAIGADLETIKNWVRRGIISRARVGGRQMPNRLFSAEDIYKAAVTYELVKRVWPPQRLPRR